MAKRTMFVVVPDVQPRAMLSWGRGGDTVDLNELRDRKECGVSWHAPQLPYRRSLSIVGYKSQTPFRNALICIPAYYILYTNSFPDHLLHRLFPSLHATLFASLLPPHSDLTISFLQKPSGHLLTQHPSILPLLFPLSAMLFLSHG
jgi:hypothetical protein